jgi:phosphate transport system substrate-binding protein
MKRISKLIMMAAMISALACAGVRAAAAEQRIAVSGAWALYPMMVVWAEAYQKVHKDVVIDVSAGGAGKGAADTLSGMVNIGMISREAHPDETSKGGVFIPVAKDAVVATISSKNPALKELLKHGVRKEVFTELWMSGGNTTWGSVSGSKSADPVRVYTRSDACGAAESWAKFLGGKQEDLKGVGVYGDPGLLEAVRRDPLGIGFNNYSYVYEQKSGKMLPGLAIVPIDANGNGKVDPGEKVSTRALLQDAIRKGTYPHPPARPLYLMTLNEPKGAARDFILWILTDGQKLLDKAGFMPIPEKQLKEQLVKYKGKSAKK